MQEHLDLATYRFDAWRLGIVHQRLYDQRFGQCDRIKGIHLGAYGWVHDLRPGGARTEAPQSDIPKSLRGNFTVYKDGDSQGFIHGPSMHHAITAAVLRSGYISNRTQNDLENKMAVNLSSERVRIAMNLVEGIRNGQSLGALLGYQFEKGLHENYTLQLDAFIYPLRRRFPLVYDVTAPAPGEALETLPPQNVVEGADLLMAVRELYQSAIDASNTKSFLEIMQDDTNTLMDGLLDSDSNPILSSATQPQLEAIIAEIDRMAASLDALGDLAVAEGMFQTVKGNHERAAAAAELLQDTRNVQDPEIIRTPRTGTVLTHRLAMPLNITSATGTTVRAAAEPTLNAWIGQHLPPAANIRCLASYPTPDNTGTIAAEVSWADLALEPVDLLVIATQGADAAGSELQSRIAYHLRKNDTAYINGIPSDVTITLAFTQRDPAWTADVYSFFEVMPMARALADLIGRSRVLKGDDFLMPETLSILGSPAVGIQITEARQRIESALSAIDNVLPGIDPGLPVMDLENASVTAADLEDLAEALLAASAFDTGDSIPLWPAGTIEPDTWKALVDKATVTYADLQDKKAQVQSWLGGMYQYPDNLGKLAVLQRCAALLFGGVFRLLPQFASAALPALCNGPSFTTPPTEEELNGWLYGLARVRPNVETMESLISFKAMLPGADPTKLKPYQVPFLANDKWMGLDFTGYKPDGNKLSITLCDEGLNANPSGNLFTGLMIDEWEEIIPDRQETSGLAFQYEQPSTKPPQNLLLAVTPEIKGHWVWDDLVYSMIDAQDMACMRAVEPDHLAEDPVLAQALPAVIGMVEPYDQPVDTSPVDYNEFDVDFHYRDNIPPIPL